MVNDGTPINGGVMNPMQRDLLDMVYPVGRGFIDFTDTDYSTYLGFTWERELMGMFPIGANDTSYKIGETGGASTKKITVDNLPNYDLDAKDSGHAHGGVVKASVLCAKGTTAGDPMASSSTGNTSTEKANITVNSKGKGEPLNIMPPYKAVYYWKRVA